MNLHARNTVESSTRDSSSAASSVTWRPLLPAASVARSGSDPAQVNPVYEYSLPAHLALVSPEGSGATTTLHCSTADAPLNKRGHNPAQLGTTRGPQHAPAGTVHEVACCAQVGEQAPRDSPPQSCAGAGSSGRHDGVDRGTAECMRRREEGESFVTAVSHCPDQELGAMVADQAPGANLAAAQLLQQLDSFGKGDLLLGRFEMLGRQHRRVGGASLVAPRCGARAPPSPCRPLGVVQVDGNRVPAGMHRLHTMTQCVVCVSGESAGQARSNNSFNRHVHV